MRAGPGLRSTSALAPRGGGQPRRAACAALFAPAPLARSRPCPRRPGPQVGRDLDGRLRRGPLRGGDQPAGLRAAGRGQPIARAPAARSAGRPGPLRAAVGRGPSGVQPLQPDRRDRRGAVVRQQSSSRRPARAAGGALRSLQRAARRALAQDRAAQGHAGGLARSGRRRARGPVGEPEGRRPAGRAGRAAVRRA